MDSSESLFPRKAHKQQQIYVASRKWKGIPVELSILRMRYWGTTARELVYKAELNSNRSESCSRQDQAQGLQLRWGFTLAVLRRCTAVFLLGMWRFYESWAFLSCIA